MRSLLISLILASLGLSIVPAPARSESQMPTRIQRAAEFYHNHDGFMGVVAVQRDHHLIYESGYGYANVASKTPFTQQTRFPIGSLSKQFTAAAILLLQDDGKLKTNDPLRLYYQNASAAWSTITLRNLLTQTSGIPDFDFGRIHRDSPNQPEELLKDILNKPLGFQPGTKFEYTNTNYMLLSAVVERVSGKPFCQFLHDRIFRPLQLEQTGCAWNPRVAHSAQGHHPSPQGPVAFEDNDLAGLAGAGSLYSSADDLIRWTEALHGGSLLSEASLTEMTTPFLDGYGYGLSIDGEGAQLDISHNGTVEGFFSCLDYLPATHTTVVVLSNQVAEGNQSSPGTLALDTELVQLAIDENMLLPSEGKEVQIAEKVLRGYTGRYLSVNPDNPIYITLTFRDGKLFIQNDTGPALPLRAESAKRFYLSNQETEIVFDAHIPGQFGFLNYSPISGTVFNRIPEAKKPDATNGNAAPK
ncbi:serine hydrolase domain-containing protein [Terracidiphilus gabretensis]|uniref:serine hydrolase domain-containing protein n=1 Tax=Terracidiphilus gabretensis TaxID=1577687 RepID=UPI00071B8F0C|nr:serine hydrolase domain-containing protein [Terracidiphilus gabretensis]